MKKILSYIVKYILPLLMGIGIFVLLYKQFNFNEIMSILQSDMNLTWVIVSMLIGVVSHLSRALRWQLQLRAIGVTPSFGTLCNAIFGTYAFNLVLPRFGELWRCTYVADREQASFSRIFGSMLSDRVADTLSVAIITTIVFFLQMGVVNSFLAQNPHLQSQVRHILTSPWLYAMIVVLVAVCLFLWKHKGNNPFMAKVREMLHNLGEGFNSVASMKTGKKRFLLYTIMIWGCYFLQLYVCSWAFDWMHHITVLQALVLFVLGSIGMAVPVQGGIGPWHAAVIFGMMFYGFSHEQAGAFALVAHGSQMIVTILLGIYTTVAVMLQQRNRHNLKNNF